MQGKNLFVCPRCHSFYNVLSSYASCQECGCPLQETTIAYDKYNRMDDIQKKDAKYAYLIESGVDQKTAASDVYFVDAPNTKWLAFLMVCGIIAFIGYLVDAIAKMLTVVGFINGIKSLVTGLLILAATGVTRQVVLDIHKIRNDVARHTNR